MKSSALLFGGVILSVAVAAALCLHAFPILVLGVRSPLPIFLLAATAALRLLGLSPIAATAGLSSSLRLLRAFEATSLIVFGCASAAIGMLIRRSRDAEAIATASQVALARHAEFLDKALQPIFSWDQQGTITYWNAGAETLYGFSREEVVGRPYHSFLRKQSSLALDDVIPVLAREKRWRGELRHLTKDGREIAVESQMTLVEDCSGRTAILETNRDISDREKTEEALLRTNHRLQQLAYAAAHDLQEPLRNLALTLDLLNVSHGSCLGDDGGALVHEGIRNARRMHRMISDLRVFGTISDSVTEVFSAVDTTDVIRDVLQLLADRIDESGGEIVFGTLPVLNVERTHLMELFQHLIANALKYRAVNVPPRIQISATLHNSEWVFTVADNGIGFDQAYAGRIFEIFRRLHRAPQNEGSGMGLAICSLIVTEYGGRIWAEGASGKGATFHFTFPASRAHAN